MGYRNGRSQRSHKFRPTICDVLETRTLLSSLTGLSRAHPSGAADVREAGQGLTARRQAHSTHRHGANPKASPSSEQPMVVAPAAPNVLIPKGYKLSLLSTGLNFPDAITFGPNGKSWVSEAAFLPDRGPRIVQIDRDGTTTPILVS